MVVSVRNDAVSASSFCQEYSVSLSPIILASLCYVKKLGLRGERNPLVGEGKQEEDSVFEYEGVWQMESLSLLS